MTFQQFVRRGAGVGGGLALAMFAASMYANVTGSLLPISDGTYRQWTPSAGSAHATLVDESACNGKTDYVSTDTVGNRDSYGVSLSGIPNEATITRIDITPCASRNQNGNGSATLKVFYRYSGVQSADAGAYDLSGITPVPLAPTSFSGLAHAKNSGSTLEIGVVLSAGTKGARLSNVSVVITYAPLQPPAAPSNFSATNGTSTNIALAWQDNASNESGFVVDRALDVAGPFSAIATTTPNTTSYLDTGLAYATTYYYRVHAFNASGNSANSNGASTTTPFPDAPSLPTVPPMDPFAGPSNLNASVSGSTTSLTWTDNSSPETGFEVERGTDGTSFVMIATVGVNATAYDDPNLDPGIYYYRVRAVGNSWQSSYSNVSNVQIP